MREYLIMYLRVNDMTAFLVFAHSLETPALVI
jgi:hypothetical protein